MLLWALGFPRRGVACSGGVLSIANGDGLAASRPVTDQNWLQLLDGLTRQFTLRRPIDLRTRSVPFVPVTWGVFRPVVLLPEQVHSSGRNRYAGTCCSTSCPRISSVAMSVFN